MSKCCNRLRHPCRRPTAVRAGTALIVLLAVALASRSVARAEELFTSRFEWAEDTNRDGWPDSWIRRTDRRRPKYVKVFLATDAAWEGKRSLKIQLNGGSVLVDSPPVAVQGQYRYVAEAYVRSRGLVRDRFFLVLRYLDSKGKPVAELV